MTDKQKAIKYASEVRDSMKDLLTALRADDWATAFAWADTASGDLGVVLGITETNVLESEVSP